MRLEDVSPRTWLLGAAAGWALVVWVLAIAGMGSKVSPLPDDPSLLQPLPQPTRSVPERLAPFGQYAEIAARPLFSQDRRPQPFWIDGGEDKGNGFDYVLTSVLLVPQVKLVMIQPTGGGEALRVKLDDSVREAPAWRLVALNPRSAVFEGPGGRKTLELRVFDGEGGEPPSGGSADQAGVPTPPPSPPARPPTPAGRSLPEPEVVPKSDASPSTQQMEALRKRIEQRRAQLRAQQTNANAGPTQKTDNP